MKSRKTFKYWPFFFLLTSLEGGFALLALLTIPTDPLNSVFLGLSTSRLLMAAILLGVSTLAVFLGIASWRKPLWREEYLSVERFPKLFTTLTWLSTLIALAASIALFLIRYYDPENLNPLFQRAKPLALFIIIFGLQLSLWLLLLRKGFDTRKFQSKENLKVATIIFAVFLALFAFISISRIGLIPDKAYWAEPGIAIQGWQFALALIAGFLIFILSTKFSFKKTDLIIAILIWGIAVAIWWSVPMDVLKNSFYAPFAYPLGKSLPYSDAGFYDYLSQGLLLGKGFITKIPPRPLYVVFLASVRSITGINNYDQIMFGQTLVLALFPVVLYFLGKILHSRAAGITIAFFGVFREFTNLLVSSQTRVSNSRMTLTDLFTTLVLSLLTLVVINWFQKHKKHPHFPPLIAGGIFGVLLLLRTQSMLILPFIILLSLFIFFPRWKNWGIAITIFMLGVSLSISPWLKRNHTITGAISFDDPRQIGLLASQYQFSNNLSNEAFDFENESLSNSIISFTLQNPGFVARFISTHFLATEINGLLALPLIEPFEGFQEPINLYWTTWNGNLSLTNQFLLIFYLATIAIGISATWHRLGWIGLTPLVFNLGYALSNGVARFSGWRYDLPADWVVYFYFGIGAIEILAIIASLFGIKQEVNQESSNFSLKPRAGSLKMLISALLFLLIGFTPIILEKNIPTHFENFSEPELLDIITQNNANVKTFAEQEDSRIIMGRLLYPRFHPRGLGIYSANPWPAYKEQDFSRMGFILINAQRTDIIFPVKKMPTTFPNGVDVIVLGCQKNRYFEGRLIYTLEGDETLLSQKKLLPCNE